MDGELGGLNNINIANERKPRNYGHNGIQGAEYAIHEGIQKNLQAASQKRPYRTKTDCCGVLRVLQV
jgi:hypothetical protein